jgi:hypothetical protein
MAVETREADVTSLEKLAVELGARGFDTHLSTPDDRLPFLTVRNPEAARLTEVILADGGSFWWSWTERITGVANLGGAADAVARVLAIRA